jgi:hypothetical protein
MSNQFKNVYLNFEGPKMIEYVPCKQPENLSPLLHKWKYYRNISRALLNRHLRKETDKGLRIPFWRESDKPSPTQGGLEF